MSYKAARSKRVWPRGGRTLQSGIRAVSTVGRSLDRTGQVLGLLLSKSLSAETNLLLHPLNSMPFTRLALISLSKE